MMKRWKISGSDFELKIEPKEEGMLEYIGQQIRTLTNNLERAEETLMFEHMPSNRLFDLKSKVEKEIKRRGFHDS